MTITDLKKVKILIIAHNRERIISSMVLLLRRDLERHHPSIVVIDNGSNDRTSEMARSCGAKVLRFKRRMDRKKFLKRAMAEGVKEGHSLFAILDIMGNNTAEDGISLINASIKEGKNFASAFIKPETGTDTIGCWTFSKKMANDLISKGKDFEDTLLNAMASEELKMKTLSEDVMVHSKRISSKNLRFPNFKRFKNFRRDNPLKFYGGLGFLFLSFSLVSGFLMIDHFYKHNELNYPISFLTVGLLMIGSSLMVTGLMLNAINVLVERLEAMKKWL